MTASPLARVHRAPSSGVFPLRMMVIARSSKTISAAQGIQPISESAAQMNARFGARRMPSNDMAR